MDEEINKKVSLLEVENQSLKAEIQRLQSLLEAAGVEYAIPSQSPKTEHLTDSHECIMNENISVEQIAPGTSGGT